MQLHGRNVVVVGAGKSGVAAANFCASRGANVTLTDKNAPDVNIGARITREFGGHQAETFLRADLIVLSPGVPPLPEVQAARQRGVEITGEIELASRFIEAPIVAITGTNGKSTVTALAGEIAKQTGRPTFVGGNLGTPLITSVDEPPSLHAGIGVVELSSFQLETCETFHPRAAALLNLTPDHLDRYMSVEEYGAAKLRIAQRMTRDDHLVVNANDPFFERHFQESTATGPMIHWFGRPPRQNHDLLCGFKREDALVLSWPLAKKVSDTARREELYPLSELSLIGAHNQSNALAALLLMRAGQLATYEQARAGLRAFRALPHRMQLVGEWRDVKFYDDSKATNVDSVVAGVDGFPVPFALIAGGRDKGGSYAPLVEALRRGTCRGVVLIGEAADKIAAAIGSAIPIARATSMAEAVKIAASQVKPGDAVVLSPACSSFDMFQNYAHRGEMFADAVAKLTHEKTS